MTNNEQIIDNIFEPVALTYPTLRHMLIKALDAKDAEREKAVQDVVGNYIKDNKNNPRKEPMETEKMNVPSADKALKLMGYKPAKETAVTFFNGGTAKDWHDKLQQQIALGVQQIADRDKWCEEVKKLEQQLAEAKRSGVEAFAKELARSYDETRIPIDSVAVLEFCRTYLNPKPAKVWCRDDCPVLWKRDKKGWKNKVGLFLMDGINDFNYCSGCGLAKPVLGSEGK
jgi:hypothetical protein